MEERWDFDSWAESYDEDVMSDGWIHSDYERVLRLVAERAKGVVVDVGCGTGNILRFLRCERYIGVEPSEGMRKAFREKWGFEPIDGHFLEIPLPEGSADTVVSTYAFHHVPDEEKGEAIREMLRVLRPGGILIIADVMFESEDEKRRIGEEDGILEEVLEEYFATLDHLGAIFERLGVYWEAERVNRYVWVVAVEKHSNLLTPDHNP
ncbi:SAM-dependent methyltransferase, UbiE/COQ5 family [Thermococcus kodakarensis KOD1]|uniref:SAM-dependent methyltransferase, UbiE/COQ5 family n=2 Tax=Thermococcus TaxID=2263 RepID=Q5JFQ4_THEKO|nr:class I SAM-dependent methyltransferase [Thermococcus kodakarensis]WCN29155.1 class I SAM-dependent methyltransferase [Thermococcus kodakarensis]BAD84413.1 SAM-dependent methyltransferase, UbiE/COQ5 family [Thermococcus kodakarensis KOD1]